MAVDLPPPIEPVQGEVQPGTDVAAVTFQDFNIHVLGANVLDADTLTRAAAGADTLSNAVRAIASAYAQAGYPTARLTYSLAEKDLYLLVTLGNLAGVEGDPLAEQYFGSLPKDVPLTAANLEPRRILASVHADRRGRNLLSEVATDASGNSLLRLKQGPDGPDPTQIRVEMGNPGNRFVGRYFVDFDLRTSTDYGDEFRAIARSGQHGFSENEEGDYFEQHLGWNRVTSWGIFGVGGRYVDYSFDAEDTTTGAAVPLNGEIWIGEAFWLYPVLADYRSRLTLQGKFDRTSKTGDVAVGGQNFQRELYNSLEVAATYQRSLDFAGFRWDVDGGLAVRKGLGDEESTRTTANQAYLLYRPTLRIRNYLTERYTVALELSAQLTSDTVPEQQQWVLGGMSSLTAAVPGLAVGDEGYLARVVGEAGTYTLYNFVFTPKVFIESGNTKAGVVAGSPALTDIGGELNVRFNEWLDGTVAYAEAITDSHLSEEELRRADANLFFRLQARF